MARGRNAHAGCWLSGDGMGERLAASALAMCAAESDAPPKPDDAKGIKGKIYKSLQNKAGSSTPSANRITLLRDTDGDGVADNRNGAFIGQHGSWNRDPPNGYKLILVPFANGKPAGMPEDVLSDLLNDKGESRGRLVGVAIDKAGAVLLADDVGGAWLH
jgi:glucose/arabinose dehydrogenase